MRDEIVTSLTTLAASSLGGSITIATIPTAVTTLVPATGIASWFGCTVATTTIVAAPVVVPAAAICAIGGLLTYGGLKAYRYFKAQENR